MSAPKRSRQQKTVSLRPHEILDPPASFRKKVLHYPGAELALEKIAKAGLNKELIWYELWKMTRPADESRPRVIRWNPLPGLPVQTLRRFPSRVRSWADEVEIIGTRIQSDEAFGHFAHNLPLYLEWQVMGKKIAEVGTSSRALPDALARRILERRTALPNLAELPGLLRFYADSIEAVYKLTAHHAPKAAARFKAMLQHSFIENVKRVKGGPRFPDIATLLNAAYSAHGSSQTVDAHNLSMQYSRHSRRKQ
jgi:hypothetical protein